IVLAPRVAQAGRPRREAAAVLDGEAARELRLVEVARGDVGDLLEPLAVRGAPLRLPRRQPADDVRLDLAPRGRIDRPIEAPVGVARARLRAARAAAADPVVRRA